WTWSSLPHQKPPGGAAVAVGEAETIREVGEFVEPDVCEVVSGVNTVADVLPPEPPIEARDAAGGGGVDEGGGGICRRFRREYFLGRAALSPLHRPPPPP